MTLDRLADQKSPRQTRLEPPELYNLLICITLLFSLYILFRIGRKNVTCKLNL